MANKKNKRDTIKREKTKKVVKITVTIIMAAAIVLSGIVPFLFM